MAIDPDLARLLDPKPEWSFRTWHGSDDFAGQLAHRRGLLARLGFATLKYPRDYDVIWSGNWLVVPLWLPILLTALPPAGLVLGHARRRRWARSGRCAGCGYDLMGNLSGVCPECGTPAGGELPPS